MLTQKELKDLLHYDQNTGIFTRKVSRNRYKIGSVAGSERSDGYIVIQINGKKYQAHRLAWLYMTGNWPSKFIDHIDRMKDNNKFDNLRAATQAENMQNNNGKGYYWHKSAQKWEAKIMLNGKNNYLGLFTTEQEAKDAYLRAKAKLHSFNPVPR